MRAILIITCIMVITTSALAAQKPAIEIYPEALEVLKRKAQATKPVEPAPQPPPQPAPPPVPVVVIDPEPFAIQGQAVAPVTSPPPSPPPAPEPNPVVEKTPETPAEKKSRSWWNNVTEQLDNSLPEMPEVSTFFEPTPEVVAAPTPAPAPEPAPTPPVEAEKKALPDLSNAPKNLPSMTALIGDEKSTQQATESVVKEEELPKPDANAQVLTAGEIKPTPLPIAKPKVQPKPAKKPETKKSEPKKTEQQVPSVEITGERVAEAPSKPTEASTRSTQLLFNGGGNTLSADGKQVVEGMAAKLKGTNQKVLVTGYGNKQSPTWRRDALSQTLAVRAALIDAGVASSNINVQVEGSDSKTNTVEISPR